MTMHRFSSPASREPGPLARCFVDLADTPDDAPEVQKQLVTAAQLTAERVTAADYASVTALRDGGFTTVATSGELARAVDQAQYDDDAGPCLDSVGTGAPVAVPDIGTVVRWPGFREEAFRLGLRASLSVPLFAGSGATIAALNLYGRDQVAMAPLIEAVLDVFDGEAGDVFDGEDAGISSAALDDGGREMVTGLAEAHGVRATIQRAIGVLMRRHGSTAEEGYRMLRARAADADSTLHQVATGLLAEPA
jgi:hypothetical protein